MNRLDTFRQVQVVKCRREGMSIRGTVRITGVAKNTVVNLLRDMGCACATTITVKCADYASAVCNVAKSGPSLGPSKRTPSLSKSLRDGVMLGRGRQLTPIQRSAFLTLLEAAIRDGPRNSSATQQSALLEGRRSPPTRMRLISQPSKRLLVIVSITRNFTRFTAHPPTRTRGRYSPATCIGCDMKTVIGYPDPDHVSTSFVERQNLTMRMSTRRFTRLTNAFSKKVENHGHAVALYFMFYNFCRVHQTLRITPAMEAGISNHVWSIEELVGLLPDRTTPEES